jgi:transposase InsO family protein
MQAQAFVLNDPEAQDVGVQVVFDGHHRQGDGRIPRGATPGRPKAAVELATLQWVAWFNNQRLLESIGDIPPAGAEQRYCQQLAAQAAELVSL